MGVVENDAAAGECVDGGRGGKRIAVAAGDARCVLVGENEEKVRAWRQLSYSMMPSERRSEMPR